MQPIASLDPQLCKYVRCVVFDVDDTLTRQGRVEEAAYAALWQLRDAGLWLVAVTGRPLGFAEWIARTWPVDLAVGENGAGYVRVTERGIIEGYWDTADVRSAQRRKLQAVQERVQREAPWAQISDDSWARRCDLAFDIGERVHVAPERVAQLVAIFEAEGLRASVSSVHAHAVAGDYDKAKGVVRACRIELGCDLDADPMQALFVGDSGNDAAAFAHFTLSAGVANVREHLARLPVPPRFVSNASHGRGFAEIAHTLLSRRTS
jgi:HAD superfamily hydrolase (TIGR01484 family)